MSCPAFGVTSTQRVIRLVLDSEEKGVPYNTLFSEAMEFPLVTPEDLKSLVQQEASMKLQLEGSEKRKQPKPEGNDRVFVADKAALENRLKVEANQIFRTGELQFS